MDLEKGSDRQLSQPELEGHSHTNTEPFDAQLHRRLTHQEATSTSDDNEPDWPTDWRAYTALVGCFFLMFNSWGIVNAYGSKYLTPTHLYR